MGVVTPLVKRRQRVLKPRGSPDINIMLKPLLSPKQGQHRRYRHGEGTSVRPGSWTEAKVQDGSPGNLRAPTHVHTMSEPGNRDRRPNNDPGPMRRPPSARERCEASTNCGGIVWDPEANQISDRECVSGKS
jgi:hypothetical protein